MSIDLALLPFDCDIPAEPGIRKAFAYSHTVLTCECDYGLWRRIEKLPSAPVPGDFTSYLSQDESNGYEDVCYGKTSRTPYDEPVYYVTAIVLRTIKPGESQKNKAIWAYLSLLPLDTKVALYWH